MDLSATSYVKRLPGAIITAYRYELDQFNDILDPGQTT
jgi:hypothetical protein